MFNARYSPVAVQAEITGKMQPDLWSFAQRKATAGDSETRKLSYSGIEQDGNLSIMPGELVVGRKEKNSMGRTHGSPPETGFSSLAGLYYGGKDKEAFMRDFYLLGVAKGEYQYGGDNLFGTQPMDHGIGFLRSGSISVNNNSPDDICAGDLVAWDFPDFPSGKPRDQGLGNGVQPVDNGLNPRASLNRTGTPYGKPLVRVQRFDPTDFSFQLAGAHNLFDKSKSQGGIKDLTLADLMNENRNLSTLQEEALGWAFGLLIIGSRAVETAANRQEAETWLRERLTDGGSINDLGRTYLNSVFLRNTNPGSNINAINAVSNSYAKLSKNSYAYMADNVFNILCGGIAGAWYAKASRIIGKAMGNSKSTQMLDLMVSHFKLCG